MPVIRLPQLKEFLDSRNQIMSPQECSEISTNLNTCIAGNTKKNRLLMRWLPVSLFIIAILGGVWWVISKHAITTKAPKEIVISLQNAPKYVDQIKTVQGKIVKVDKRDKVCYLSFGEDYKTAFTVLLFKSDFNKFPYETYQDKVIKVTGKITKDDKFDRFIIKSPVQIEILNNDRSNY